MTELNQAVVLITGAAGGFGQELTRQLLQAGSLLILTDLDLAALQAKVATIQRDIPTGRVIDCFAADLSSREGCDRLYQQVQALQIPVDILINNAGIGLYGRMDEVPADKWERLMQVNLLAPMRLSAQFGADMIARQQGHIVNISSLAGWTAQAGLAHYATSKFGLRGLSEGLWNEMKPYNVKVTAVYPYFSRTPILQSERYGSLAEGSQGFPEEMATDPAAVMQETLQGIRRDQLHVFPDRVSKTVYLLQRYSPQFLDWISGIMNRRLKNGAGRSQGSRPVRNNS